MSDTADVFNVLFIGGGNVMFGSNEGPWNHSLRLEQKLGKRLRLVAVIDPLYERATLSVQRKRDNPDLTAAYENTRFCRNLDEFIETMAPHEKPRGVVVGSPPAFRGTLRKGADIEVQILQKLPGVPIFIEKPITTGPESDLNDTLEVGKKIADANIVSSVGYMLRYLKATQEMKRIIRDNNLTVMATNARYACAYESCLSHIWWDKSKSGGPVIEQGTHFCDLSRHFGGEVDIDSVNANTLEWDEKAGKLSKVGIDESKVAPENRIPRCTAANWKYRSGAVGNFIHIVALQGTDYSCEFEVYADGYQLRLVNPYVKPALHVRRPGNDEEEIIPFHDDDPFFTEISSWVNTIEGTKADGDSSPILSTFEDACRTYELTWAIRRASEKSRVGIAIAGSLVTDRNF